MANFKRNRPTIGILPGYTVLAGKTLDHYRLSILRGVQSAARSRGCNLLMSWGLGHVTETNDIYPAWPIVSSDSDFVPVGPWNTDGLIVFAPLQNEVRSHYLQDLKDQGFPVLFIATGEKEPIVSVDNEIGIRQAVKHLVVDHGHHHIAYIAGHPEDNGDSASRLRAFHSAVIEYGLDNDPRLIANGFHSFAGGYDAIRQIIESGVKFTAVVASNDACAIGAMQAVQATTSLNIPDDIAIIGFDDQLNAIAQVPPLASIHIPLAEIGEQALTLMSDHLTGNYDLKSVRIPTRLVTRQSCGCLPDVVTSMTEKRTRSRVSNNPLEARVLNLHEIQQNVVAEMVAALPPSSRFPFGEQTNRFCLNLVEAFYTSLNAGDSTHFQHKLIGSLREMERTDENIDPWQSAITVLQREMTMLPATWKRSKTKRLAENMLHQARVAFSESTQRQVYRHQYEQQIADRVLGELTTRLGATLDERQAVEILEENLADVGIRHARVALFEADENDPVAWSIIINSHLKPVSLRFPSRGFPPPGLYPKNELLNLIILPLVFQKESFGYVAFDANNLEPCATIARQLAATIKTSRLHAQVTELSLKDPLTDIHNRRYFDLFLNNEVNRSRRLGKGMAVIMLDIDYFKKYNDTYGHPDGDKVIQNVAACMRDGRRTADVAARIGGEEFALILPETQIEGAMIVAERIQESIHNSPNFKTSITVSMGISALTTKSVKAEDLIKQADLALYEAKQTGRNRICVFKDEPSAPEDETI